MKPYIKIINLFCVLTISTLTIIATLKLFNGNVTVPILITALVGLLGLGLIGGSAFCLFAAESNPSKNMSLFGPNQQEVDISLLTSRVKELESTVEHLRNISLPEIIKNGQDELRRWTKWSEECEAINLDSINQLAGHLGLSIENCKVRLVKPRK